MANRVKALITAKEIFDTGDIPAISDFIKQYVKERPEVDCRINNAGIKRPLDVDNFDLAKVDQRIDINIRGPMRLAIGLLDYFIVNVSSVLGYIPTVVMTPVYNCTKASLRF